MGYIEFDGMIYEEEIENMATLIYNAMCDDDETADESEINAIAEDIRYLVENISTRRRQREKAKWKSEHMEYICEFDDFED